MSNFDTIFQRLSTSDLQAFHQKINSIRKGANTKKKKIDAIKQQSHYLHLLYNSGAEFGGSDGFDAFNDNIYLDFFNKQDIDYIFAGLKIPQSNNKVTILGDLKKVYSFVQYLDFTFPKKPEPIIGPERKFYFPDDSDDSDIDVTT